MIIKTVLYCNKNRQKDNWTKVKSCGRAPNVKKSRVHDRKGIMYQ